MLTAIALLGVLVGFPTIFFGLASAFIPVWGRSQQSAAPGLITAACGAVMIVAAVLYLAVT